jgi:signal transduction histidine kinase
MEMGLEDNNLDILKRIFPVFRRSTDRISNFVQDMLSFSKAREPLRESCNIQDLVNEACDSFHDLFTQKDIKLHRNIMSLADPVYIDSQGIFRCLLNLLSNAAAAASGQNGSVSVTTRLQANELLEIEVKDNGTGVPEEFREKIFDPFFSTKGSQGTGLGLAVTRKIIREHGGDIDVEDNPGGGALFRIVLPTGEQQDKKETIL